MRLSLHAMTFALLSAPALAQGADDCAMAPAIAGPGPFAYDTTGATTDGAADPLCLAAGQDQVFNDVWFSWTAADTGPHFASLCGISTGDSRIAIYEGGCTSVPTACNDDSCGLISEVGFSATAGQSYLVRIGNFGATGTSVGDFTIEFTPPLQNPANGHFYALVNENLSWTEASLAAESTMFAGATGRLVSITDQAELDWILTNLAPSRTWIGLRQNTASPNFVEPAGGFEWVTGESFAFANWSSGEPNNSNGTEDFVEMFASGAWNDVEDNFTLATQYIIEWGGTNSIGQPFCTPSPNSTGAVGALTASGSTDVSANSLSLALSGLPPLQFGIVVVAANGGASTPVGSGILCLVGPVGRYSLPGEIYQVDGMGATTYSIDISAIRRPTTNVATVAGDTWYFQAWHRDNLGMGPTSNFTGGVQITFN